MSALETARLLGVSERTIRRAIRSGDLPASKKAGAFRITPEALEQYQQRRARRSARHRWPGTRLPALPDPRTSFVGRARDVARVAALLRDDDVQLVTLTGPGGVGKTRLALRVAAEVAADFAHDVAFVPLAPVHQVELVIPTIAQVLDVRGREDQPVEVQLRSALRERTLLLVLDNLEQVTAAGPALGELLAACPRLRLLITSRAPLRLSAEQVYPVPPLALPGYRPTVHGASLLPPLEELGQIDAIRLFVARAQAVRDDFTLAAENASAVAAVCERVNGLPLAIELAAVRTRVLTPSDLLARLSPQLPLLSGGPADQPARLRSMANAIAWSYDLLPAAEQALFRRLAVFVGGFGLEAAEWVGGSLRSGGDGGFTASGGVACGSGGKETDDGSLPTLRPPSPPESAQRTPPPEGAQRPAPPEAAQRMPPPEAAVRLAPPQRSDPPSVLDSLTALVDQSLLQWGPGPGGQTRYGMLEPVREYGVERLAESGEESAVRDAHADWCLAFAGRAEPELAGPDAMAWVRRIEVELGNIRAAHAWLFARCDAARALRLGGALGWFWSSGGYFLEGRALYDRLLAMPGVTEAPAALGKVLHAAGDVEQWLGNLDRAQEHFGRALTIYRNLDDRKRIVAMLRGLGSVAVDRGDLESAEHLLGEVQALAPEASAAWEGASAANLLGIIAFTRGDDVAAMRLFQDALAGWQEVDDTGHAATARVNLARALLAAGESRPAAAAAREVLPQLADTGDDILVCDCFEIAAALAERDADLIQATRLLAASDTVQRRLGIPRWPVMQALFDSLMTDVRDALGEPAFTAAWAAGAVLPLAAATAEVMAVLDRVAGCVAAPRPAPSDPEALTRRERQVLRLLVAGLSDKEIAHALGVRQGTVSHHVGAIRCKLGAASRTAAVAMAVRSGLHSS
jgi:excisionase family DNA binding protein